MFWRKGWDWKAVRARLGTVLNENYFATENGKNIDYSAVLPLVHLAVWFILFAAVFSEMPAERGTKLIYALKCLARVLGAAEVERPLERLEDLVDAGEA